MIPLMKKNASEAEKLAWAKTQAAHEAGFRYGAAAHDADCNCGGEHAVKAKHLTKEDMLNGRD
jgi:hypothetical protein